MENTFLEGAIPLIEAGIPAFPTDDNKAPTVSGGLYEATTDPEKIRGWAKNGHATDNPAFLTGLPSGVVIVDADNKEAYEWMREHYGPPTVESAHKNWGGHWWFAHPGRKVRSTALAHIMPKLDIKGEGGYALVPPSKSKKWTNGMPDISSLPKLPAELLPQSIRINKPSEPQMDGETFERAITTIAEHYPASGLRHNFGLGLAGFLLRHKVSEEDTFKMMYEAYTRQSDVPRNAEQDVRGIVSSTAQKLRDREHVSGGPTAEEFAPGIITALNEVLGWGKRKRGLTDLGNGLRFADRYKAQARYVPEWEKWIVWDGRRWKVDTSGKRVVKFAHKTALSIFEEATQTEDKDEQKALAQWAIQSQNYTRIGAMISSAAPYLLTEHTELDKDPWLFNCTNGTLNLWTGELQDRAPRDLITKLAPVAYNRHAQAPAFEKFLSEILPEEDLRVFVQRLLGYSLTGMTSEHVLPFWYGLGANGKSTLINAILKVIGDYGKQAAPDLLLAKRDSHPTELADLFGARFVASVEIEDGRRLAESLVKQLTGGDRIKARRMREDFWEFDPTHKICLVANHRPVVRGTDHAIWRRIKLIPFVVQIPPEKQDKQLPEKLSAELSGILAWLVRGCRDWYEHGLTPPEEVLSATQDYRDEMDILGEFMRECCIEHPNAQVPSQQLWSEWQKWCAETGEKEGTRQMFGRRLSERGFVNEKAKAGDHKDRVVWYGVGLKSSAPDPNGRGKGGDSDPKASAGKDERNISSAAESRIDKPNPEGERRIAEDCGGLFEITHSKSPSRRVNPETPPQSSAGGISSANELSDEAQGRAYYELFGEWPA
jgi:P4 family phage/plasmid primase-like protien